MKPKEHKRIFQVQMLVRRGIAVLDTPLQNGQKNILPQHGWVGLDVFSPTPNDDDDDPQTNKSEDKPKKKSDSGALKSNCSLDNARTCYEYHRVNTLRKLDDAGGEGEIRIVAFEMEEVITSTTKSRGVDIFS